MTHVKIKKEFVSDKAIITQIKIKNHSDFDELGYDIVCAAVSSAAELVINTLTENFTCECEVKILNEPPEIVIIIPVSEFANEKKSFAVAGLLDGFVAHLKNIEREYPQNLRVISF